MCTNHPETISPTSLVHGRTVFQETSPSCQEVWGPLFIARTLWWWLLSCWKCLSLLCVFSPWAVPGLLLGTWSPFSGLLLFHFLHINQHRHWCLQVFPLTCYHSYWPKPQTHCRPFVICLFYVPHWWSFLSQMPTRQGHSRNTGRWERGRGRNVHMIWPHLCKTGDAVGKESACHWRRLRRRGFDPWVGKIPWGKKW